MSPTNFRKPKTAAPLIVQYRNGYVSPRPYTANQLRWSDTGSDWDVVAAAKADERKGQG